MTMKHRRLFLGMGLAAGAASTLPARAAQGDSGGAAVFAAVDDAAAAAIIAADPAVTSGTFQYELKRWRLNPWEEISKQWAERGQ